MLTVRELCLALGLGVAVKLLMMLDYLPSTNSFATEVLTQYGELPAAAIWYGSFLLPAFAIVLALKFILEGRS